MNQSTKRNYIAWGMWGIMIITYMFNTFHAVTMGVIRQDLISQFSLSEGQYVLLMNAFSYSYMIMQIPAGILLDKIGAKQVACIGNAIAGSGTLLFALGQDYPTLLIGRCLIGLGSSVCFISVLKICSEWFDAKKFCAMSGLTSFVGMLGAVLAQTPLAILSSHISWRFIFGGISGITFFIVILIGLIVKNKPQDLGLPSIRESIPGNNVSILKAVWGVLRNRWTWPPLIAYGCFYGTYLVISGLYGSSMLSTYYNVSSIKASSYISFTILGCAVGSVIISFISDKLSNRRYTQIITGIGFIMIWIFMWLFIGKIDIIYIYPLMFFLGFFSCAYSVCWSCVMECNHPDFTGISTSIANMGGYLGSILVPTIAGQIYSSTLTSNSEPHAFQNVILTALIINIIGVISAIMVKETKGGNIYVGKSH